MIFALLISSSSDILILNEVLRCRMCLDITLLYERQMLLILKEVVANISKMKDEGEYHKTILGNTFTYADRLINKIRRCIKVLSNYST